MITAEATELVVDVIHCLVCHAVGLMSFGRVLWHPKNLGVEIALDIPLPLPEGGDVRHVDSLYADRSVNVTLICSPIELDTDGATLLWQDGRASWGSFPGSRRPATAAVATNETHRG